MKNFISFIFAISLAFPHLLNAKMQVIPLHKTHEGYLEIEASINHVNAKFILDTGATGTVIDTNKLNVFGITKGKAKIDGVAIGSEETGIIETFSVDITQFSIGQAQLNIKSIYSNESSGRFAPNIMGLIGYDALSHLNALLDVKKAQLLIPENKNDTELLLSKSTTVKYEVIELYKSPMGFNFVDVQLSENVVRLIVDTGSPELVLDESALIQYGFQLENHPTAKTIIAEGVELPMKVYRNGKVLIGNEMVIDDFLITDFSALMNAVNVEGQPPVIGILGNKHLIQLNSIIDIANAKLYIKGP
ncbi:aspartyl protease family protein [uncultured Paraglaciecola sp.]|uniref:aspartyl protease family protein n=1 Tax=uncultured Paraglaciecola sp. TaxID=1765024 RepID=UPI0025D4577D|nr:aspartyl protease family protein [uncultured Paraglaciecola sp.]